MKFKFGVRGHDLVSKGSVEELASKLSKYNLHYLQLVFPKAFKDYSYDSNYVNHVYDVLNKANIKIAMLGAYFNPVHSDINVVNQGISNFKSNLDIMKKVNADFVGSETGSFNDSPWIYVPKNRTEEGYQQSKGVFKNLLEYARKIDSNMIVEPAFGHVMYDVDTLKRMVDELADIKHLFVTIDLYNLLDPSNFDSRDEIFEHAIKTFKSRIKVFHLKDAKIIDNKLVQLAPGEGDFHYDFMLKLIKEYSPEAYLIFEGVKEDKIENSYNYLLNIAEKL